MHNNAYKFTKCKKFRVLRQSFCGKFKLSAEFCNRKNRLFGCMLWGSVWLPLALSGSRRLSLALSGFLWLTQALSGSLLLSEFAYKAPAWLTRPLFGS